MSCDMASSAREDVFASQAFRLSFRLHGVRVPYGTTLRMHIQICSCALIYALCIIYTHDTDLTISSLYTGMHICM